MCGKLVTHPVHYLMDNKSCVSHSTPPPSGKICNHYRFINITPRFVFVKAHIYVHIYVCIYVCICDVIHAAV